MMASVGAGSRAQPPRPRSGVGGGRAGREQDRDAASLPSEGRRPAGQNGTGLSGGSAGPASSGLALSALLSPAAAGAIKACRSCGRGACTQGGVRKEGVEPLPQEH